MQFPSLAWTMLGLGLTLGVGSGSAPANPTVRAQPQESRRSVPVNRGNGRQTTTPAPSLGSGRLVNPDFEPADDYELDRWFKDCNADDNSWISFYEAERAMGFTRDQFRNFDTDADGRMDKREFVAYYRYSGPREEFKTPRRRSQALPPERTPQQLLLAYDADLNGGISLSEVRRILVDYSRVPMDAEVLFTQADRNQSKLLDEVELASLNSAISRLNVPQMVSTTSETKQPFDEFFIQVTESPSRTAPPRIQGPVTPFRRLDLDGNGVISPQDLAGLEKSMVSPIRPQTILHTLDRNQDGVLDRAELRLALEHAKN
ncbi:MAG TPA: hypothetical protein P5218_12255 [Planctomycetota bacterium]|nr:hypothetical protein [Planctomycetota bacterium]